MTTKAYDPQDPAARPLTEKQKAKLLEFIPKKLATPVVAYAWTELPTFGGNMRTIWVRLKPAFNYEGRGCVLGETMNEILHNLDSVEAGSADDAE